MSQKFGILLLILLGVVSAVVVSTNPTQHADNEKQILESAQLNANPKLNSGMAAHTNRDSISEIELVSDMNGQPDPIELVIHEDAIEIPVSGTPYWLQKSSYKEGPSISEWPIEGQKLVLPKTPASEVPKAATNAATSEEKLVLPAAPSTTPTSKRPFFLEEKVKDEQAQQPETQDSKADKGADKQSAKPAKLESKTSNGGCGDPNCTECQKVQSSAARYPLTACSDPDPSSLKATQEKSAEKADTTKPQSGEAKTADKNDAVEKDLASKDLASKELAAKEKTIEQKEEPAKKESEKTAETSDENMVDVESSEIETQVICRCKTAGRASVCRCKKTKLLQAKTAIKRMLPQPKIEWVPLMGNSPEKDFFYENGYGEPHKESPGLGKILSDGAWFASSKTLFVEPHFNGNSGITVTGATSQTEPLDYGFETGLSYSAGFESKQGPGFALSYLQFDQNSDLLSVFSDGTNSVTSAVQIGELPITSSLSTAVAGESVNVRSSLEIHSFSADFFKDIKMPRARLKGIIGFQYTSINHGLTATQNAVGGAIADTMVSNTDIRLFGTKVGAEYRRPIGHTAIEMIGGLSATLFFGHRDQVVTNTDTGNLFRLGSDELTTNFESNLGAQWVNQLSEKRRLFVRAQVHSQVWLGGGSAIDPAGDFGLYGFTIGAGLNH